MPPVRFHLRNLLYRRTRKKATGTEARCFSPYSAFSSVPAMLGAGEVTASSVTSGSMGEGFSSAFGVGVTTPAVAVGTGVVIVPALSPQAVSIVSASAAPMIYIADFFIFHPPSCFICAYIISPYGAVYLPAASPKFS
jgi:hypothetical protein